MVETMKEHEIVEEILYLVNAHPNDQTLGNRVREFMNNLPNHKKVIPTSEEYLRGQIELEKKYVTNYERAQTELEKENRRFTKRSDRELVIQAMINKYGRNNK
jgi:translation initiation factor 2B subunit (eIF-2B alpha/beta/delta family)